MRLSLLTFAATATAAGSACRASTGVIPYPTGTNYTFSPVTAPSGSAPSGFTFSSRPTSVGNSSTSASACRARTSVTSVVASASSISSLVSAPISSVESAPVSSAPVISAPVISAPVSSAPVSSAPFVSVPGPASSGTTSPSGPTSAAYSSASGPASTLTSSAATRGSTGVSYAGVNIAGLDFGCDTSGNCQTSNVVDPGQDGIDQIKHFINDDGLNTFRLPVGWQFLVNNQVGGSLDATNFATYDKLVQGCLDAGAELCIIDIHNYARWNGAIVGQGGPSNTEFASLWSLLATKYKNNDKVVFGIMNEPHDVDIGKWATTVQAAVTAIRQAGATSNKILLPGNDWTHASSYISDGSAEALSAVKNLDGSTTNLIFDVHQYLDSDGSGTHTNCVTDNADSFRELGDYLRQNKRQAILTETGGGSTDETCLANLCKQFDVLNEYSDVYLGWTGWAAGKFDSSYELAETPSKSGSGGFTDLPLVKQCIVGKFKA
ncbi:Endoglucanase EG-II [Cercospora beticola]|uniref:Endoglucanase EG-II n=1 Tax=Cercospora beticola TaxID=122368 RepID=A0A2G5HQY8_CERBT|nr:Endoglucanase EG-II [Cercospora beticola]PIA94966.1 Endoglucanase EG-II [Cercospora beticola]WPB05407.1 Endoglucanase EG-II [Cercospora beticola]CAK1365210.1 unnamed protein product [Cercospora beticola]